VKGKRTLHQNRTNQFKKGTGMTTTVLFIEHLITGFQAFVWLTLLIFSLFGFDWFSIARIKGLETGVAILIISMMYPIGVFIDELADKAFKPWERKIKNKIRDEHGIDDSLSVWILLATTKDEMQARYLGYVRTRIRISRSAALNFALITVTSIIFTFTRLKAVLGSILWKLIIFEFILGTIITIVAIYSWFSINKTYGGQIARGFDQTKNNHAPKK
jgi:hypothetical protein